MIITGTIIENNDGEILISASFPSYLIDKREISEVEIIITDGRTISAVQRKHIYATLRDISLYTGHTPEELKAIFKADYIAKTGTEYFSLSNVDMTTAYEFLQHLIEFCIDNDIPSKDSYLDRAPDIAKYLYRCIATRSCAICNQKAELYLSGIDDRDGIHHLGLKAIALCPNHHRHDKNSIRNLSERRFCELHHIWPIKLDTDLCKTLGLKV